MAELNDKLITYGNLSTFYDKLQEQGLGGNAIEEVSELPNASENKDKLFRLESDDNVYVSELKSRTTTTTNRLPDVQQIDKAYIHRYSDYAFYKGEYTLVCTDGEINGYAWAYNSIIDNSFLFTLDNAEHASHQQSKCYFVSNEDGWSISGNTAVSSNYTVSVVNGLIAEQTISSMGNDALICATYNAPEATQINYAYFIDEESKTYEYSGIKYTFVVSDGTFEGYAWTLDGYTDGFYLTDLKASDIYGEIDLMKSDVSARYNYGSNTKMMWVSLDGFTKNGNTYTNNNASIQDYKWVSTETMTILKLYIPQLNAPDSEQVGHATIEEDYITRTVIYTGEEVTFEYNNEQITGYKWVNVGTPDSPIYSTKRAYQIYNTNRDSDDVHFYIDDESNISELKFDNSDLILVSTVKYQRTEVTEEWDWQPLTDNATNDDIDAMFESSPVVKRVLMSDYASPLSIKEGLVNVSGETMEYEGQTYYKWVKYEEHDGESVIDDYGYDTELVVLTTSLNPSLPFSDESPEYAYHLVIDGTEGQYWGLDTYPEEALIHEDGSITYEE